MNQNEVENEVYFRIHILLVVIGVSCYLTAIGWLIWRIAVGGAFELALGIVVIGVLLCVMSTACGSAAVIAWEGRSQKSKVKPVPAHPRLVSASRWTIQSPLQRRRPS
jgi:predicted small integral membrane protein